MKSIRRAAFAAWAAVALACGAAPEDEELFGELDQEFSGHVTDNFQFGTRKLTTLRRCDKTSTGQVCAIFNDPTPSWCSASTGTGAFTASDRTLLTNMISGLDGALANWTFSQQGSGCSAQIAFRKATVPGSLANNISGYTTVSFGSGTALTEGAGVAGQYQSHGSCVIDIDVDDINAKANTDINQRNRFFRQAARNGLGVCLGLGRREGSPNTATRENVQTPPGASEFVYSAAEMCQLNGFSLTSPGHYFHDLPDCAGD